MAGHSKWKKIKHKKSASDAKRGKIFTKHLKEITVAARGGGGDPGFNPRLRVAIQAAKASNVPGVNVERAIKKGTGALEGQVLEEVTYEGYGPGGTALLVEVITDNKKRTVADIRAALTKYGGNLGAAGSVGWMFTKKGLITVDKEHGTEDQLLEIILDAGAEDLTNQGDFFEIHTTPDAFEAVREALEKNKVKVDSAEISMTPNSSVHLSGKAAETMLKLMEILEDHDDVNQVHSNFDIDDKEIEKIAN